MSQNFYTNVTVWGSKILYRGIENGKKVRRRIDYNPPLYLLSNEPTEFKTIHNEYLQEIKPGSIRECKEFVDRYQDVQNFKIYGNQKYEYVFISESFPDKVEWDKNLISICNIDIEVGSENGFPEPETASEPITAITMKTNDKFVVFACGDFNNTRSDVRYMKCSDEIDLIKRFIDEWTGNYPDIITGWNVAFFDIPYLINRIVLLLGEEFAQKLSPWNVYREKMISKKNYPDQKTYDLKGICVFDYLELYRKFAPGGTSQDSYTLDNICSVEINERKLSYEEYDNLHLLYRQDFQKFIEYNIRDVELVEKLDDKLKLIDLGLILAYDSHSNFSDVFKQVRMWDNIIYNKLRSKNIIVPPEKVHEKNEAYIGAYVKEPVPNMYHWIASYDLTSLYPHLIMQFNISPDTFISPENYTPEMRKYLSEHNISIQTMLTQELNTSPLKMFGATMTPNAQFFTLGFKGFLAEIMEDMFDIRNAYKDKAKEAKKELELELNKEKRFEIEKQIAKYNILHIAKKVCLNSAYGALGSKYFRFFDVRQASAITTAGQLAIQWIQDKLNSYLNKILETDNKDYIIASDTDSVYLNFDELVRKTFAENSGTHNPRKVISFLDRACESKIQPFIDKSYKELAEYTNALNQKMHMKREALADRGLWTAKKRYILNVYNNEGIEFAKPKIKVTGLEMIKSSTPSSCREKLWEAVEIIMNKDEQAMQEFIQKYRVEFETLPIPDIAFPRSANNLKKYTSSGNRLFGDHTPIHVRGSIIYNDLLKKNKLLKKYPVIHEGEKVRYIYLKEPNHAHSNIISFSKILPKEFNLDQYIDYDTQFQKSFLDPLNIILDVINWKAEKQNSLLGYFS